MTNAIRRLAITHSPLSSAVWTGLEPATPCVTGRYSNQLNYHTKFFRGASGKSDFRWLRLASSLFPFCECKVNAEIYTMQIFLKNFSIFYSNSIEITFQKYPISTFGIKKE